VLPELKLAAIRASRAGQAKVFTDPAASPTGFPFKVMQAPGTMSEPEVYVARERLCDLGGLRETYRREDGSVGYRCASEPVEDYVRKGGNAAATVGRMCLCNGLAATVGLGQLQRGGAEAPIITAGDEVADLARLVPPGAESYRAEDVIRYLRG